MDIFKKIIRPILFRMSEEPAHEFALSSLRIGLGSATARNLVREKFACDDFGSIQRFDLNFRNPLGVAAGFDKNGIVVAQLAALGFAFVEVGTVTFHPQEGNPKPRLFRLLKDRALINRAGFNNEGAQVVAERLREKKHDCVIGVNIGKSRIAPIEDAASDYLKTYEIVYDVADYIVVNVSSPNTPNLRELQTGKNLEGLLREIQKRNREMGLEKSPSGFGQPLKVLKPLLLKIAPDLNEGQVEEIADVCIANDVAGIIATNTTTSRDDLKTPWEEIEKLGAGGLSGAPLRKKSNDVIARIFRASKGKLPIIGVGGIFSGEDAFEKIASGASLIQAYTGFVYEGPEFAREVNRGLAMMLRSRGFRSLDEAIGCDVR